MKGHFDWVYSDKRESGALAKGLRMKRVAIVYGGFSSERPVSLSSGQAVIKAAEEAGYEVVPIDAGPDLAEHLRREKPDAILNALHGPWLSLIHI